MNMGAIFHRSIVIFCCLLALVACRYLGGSDAPIALDGEEDAPPATPGAIAAIDDAQVTPSITAIISTTVPITPPRETATTAAVIASETPSEPSNENEAERGQWQYVTLIGEGFGAPLVWSADSQVLAVWNAEQEVHYWHVPTGELLSSINIPLHENPMDVSLSSDLSHLATSGSGGSIQIWAADSGAQQLELDLSEQDILSLDWSHNSRYLAAGSENGLITIWNNESGEVEIGLSGHIGGVWGLDWSPDSQILASVGGDTFLRLWDIATGNLWLEFEGLEEGGQVVAWSPDDQHLAAIGGDGAIRIWDILRGDPIALSDGSKTDVLDLRWSPDGQVMALSSKDALQFMDSRTYDSLGAYQAIAGQLSWSPDSTQLAVSGEPVQLLAVGGLTSAAGLETTLPPTAVAAVAIIMTPSPTNTPTPTNTPSPTNTPLPTPTPTPTNTPQATATPTPEPDANAMIKWQDLDLPPEFRAIHAQDFGVEPGAYAKEFIDPNGETDILTIANSFVFTDDEETSYIFGYTYLFTEDYQKPRTKRYLLSLKENIQWYVPESAGADATYIDAPGIGEASGGVSMLYSPEERLDTVEFLIGDVGAIVMVRYPDGQKPPFDVVKLAEVYIESLVDPTPRCVIDSVTPVEGADWPTFDFEASGFFPREQRIVIIEGDLHVGDEIQPGMFAKMGQTGESADEEGKVSESIAFGPMLDSEGNVYPVTDLQLTVMGSMSGCTASESVSWPAP